MEKEIYADSDLWLWFDELGKGYPFEEACERIGYDWERLKNTFYSDAEVYRYALDVCMIGCAKVRLGKIPVPDRKDGYLAEYRDSANWWTEEDLK